MTNKAKIIRTKVDKGGRVVIPAMLRHNLNITVGDDVVMHLKGNVICITTPNHSLDKLKQKVQHQRIKKNKISLVEELLNTRRLEAKSND